MAKECVNVVGIYDHQNEMNMRGLYKYVADSNRIQLAGSRQAGLNDCLT
jgi:hypothetical protein